MCKYKVLRKVICICLSLKIKLHIEVFSSMHTNLMNRKSEVCIVRYLSSVFFFFLIFFFFFFLHFFFFFLKNYFFLFFFFIFFFFFFFFTSYYIFCEKLLILIASFNISIVPRLTIVKQGPRIKRSSQGKLEVSLNT